jgi:hypothetical protein
MSTETTDLAGILAKFEAMKAALEQSIAGLRNMIALGGGQIGDMQAAGGVSVPGLLSSGSDMSVPAGAFFGKSIPEATELYLAIVKGKRTSKDITEALKKGGVESKTKNFLQNVHSALDRARKTGNSNLVKLDRSTWGLKQWYPAGIGVGASGGKRNQKKKGTRKTKASGSPALAATEGQTKKANERALDFLRSGKKTEYGLMDVGGHLGMGMQGARLILGKLVKAGKVEKTASQAYRIAQPKLVAASG